MEIKTFEKSYLEQAKEALKSAFYHENRNELFNEWEFAKALLKSGGYVPELCVVALEGNTVIGYNALNRAKIGGSFGLALGPLGVRKEYQNRGVGSALVNECVLRAKTIRLSLDSLAGRRLLFAVWF